MPKLIQKDAGNAPSGQLRVRSAGGAFGSQIGSSVANLGANISQAGKVLNDKVEREAQLTNQVTLAEGRAQWAQLSDEMETNSAPGATDHVTNVIDGFSDWSEKQLENAPTSSSKQTLQVDLANLGSSLSQRAIKFASAESTRFKVEQVSDIMDANINSVMTDPSNLADVALSQELVIDNMNLPEKMKAEFLKSGTESLTIAAFHGRMNDAIVENDYLSAAKLLLEIQKGNAKNFIPAEKFNVMYNSMLSDSAKILSHNVALKNQEDRRIRAANGALQEATFKDGLDLATEGKLNLDWVQSNKDRLSPENYKYMIKRSTGQIDVKTDTRVYSELRAIADAGIDVRRSANDALTRGKLELSHYNRLLDLSNVKSIQGSLPNWYEAGDAKIKRALKPSDVNPNPALNLVFSDASDDWFDWSAAHPNATADEARKEYNAIINESSLVDTKVLSRIKAKPRYLIGGRNAPDLKETYKVTAKKFKDGDIDFNEFKRQTRIITEWDDAVGAEEDKAK